MTDQSPLLNWHAVESGQLLAELGSRSEGLSASEAAARLTAVGPNRLPRRPPTPFLWVFGRQFHNPLIYILALAAAVSVAIGETTDAGFIAGVLLLNAVIGSLQEWRAERSSHALEKLVRTRTTVSRDQQPVEIDSEQIVPGDVIWLESGNRVPADARLLTAQGLEIDESLLTGESLPVVKDDDWLGQPTTPVGDRQNMVHAGSIVSRGRGRALVVATGTKTVVGQLARDVSSSPAGTPPLLLRLRRFTHVIGVLVLVAAVGVGLIGVLWQGQSASSMFLFAVALAVSAIPEGLPVALTVALAVATRRMAAKGVIVRKLAAVEGLGSCTLIATDKTGTLTCNELTARVVELGDGERFEITGQGYVPEGAVERDGQRLEEPHAALQRLATAAVLCNEAQILEHDDQWSWRGDPTDVALLAFGLKSGVTRERLLLELPQVNQIPFEPEHRFAATYHDDHGTVRTLVKGAPEKVLEMCSLDRDARAELRARAATLASQGYRVLAFAEGTQPGLDADAVPPEPSGLTFLGFVGMIDPPRVGVREAIANCVEAGVRVIMITGDHPVTALAISRELGLATREDEVVSAAELTDVTTDELRGFLSHVSVFARVSPQQKLEIVNAARAAGHFVAVTGDGVNDAPALRAANIGVAMGKTGTDVAREAAELVISDDNFATIVSGIEQGRVAYANVRKVIFLLISTGAAEVVLVGLSLAAGLPLPLLPVQLLWLNLVTNGIQDVALAFEPREGDVLNRPPRPPQERIFNRLMIERTLVSAAVMGTVGFLCFQSLLNQGYSEDAARNVLLLLMVLFENVHIGNCRSETRSLVRLSPLESPVLLIGTVAAFLIHLLALYTPIGQKLLRTAPVSPTVWAVLICLALTISVAMELHKLSWARRRNK